MNKRMIQLLKPYQRIFGYDVEYELDKVVLKNMNNCKSILDIGCGEGRFLSHDPKSIVGVDHNNKSLEICKAKGYSVKYAKVTCLPFENESVDAVHCSHVIEHLFPEDAHKLLGEMNRVLKPGGIFCLRTPLLHTDFYNDLTHIKPYNPGAIMHYIRIDESNQTTLGDIDGLYKKIKLKYRREQMFYSLVKTRFWPLCILFNILYRFGITSIKKTGYMLVLSKIK